MRGLIIKDIWILYLFLVWKNLWIMLYLSQLLWVGQVYNVLVQSVRIENFVMEIWWSYIYILKNGFVPCKIIMYGIIMESHTFIMEMMNIVQHIIQIYHGAQIIQISQGTQIQLRPIFILLHIQWNMTKRPLLPRKQNKYMWIVVWLCFKQYRCYLYFCFLMLFLLKNLYCEKYSISFTEKGWETTWGTFGTYWRFWWI